MKLEEAISRLERLFEEHRFHTLFEDREAQALVIEAGKMLKRMKDLGLVSETSLLPGETKD